MTLATNLKKYVNAVYFKYCETIDPSDEIFEIF